MVLQAVIDNTLSMLITVHCTFRPYFSVKSDVGSTHKNDTGTHPPILWVGGRTGCLSIISWDLFHHYLVVQRQKNLGNKIHMKKIIDTHPPISWVGGRTGWTNYHFLELISSLFDSLKTENL